MINAFRLLVPQAIKTSGRVSCRSVDQAIEVNKIRTVRMGETHVCIRNLEDSTATRAEINTKEQKTYTLNEKIEF